MKKLIVGLLVATVAIAGVLLVKKAGYEKHENLAQCFPADTWIYTGSHSPQHVEIGLTFADIKEYLTAETELSPESIDKINHAALSLRGSAIGIGELNLEQPELRAGLVLSGEFDDALKADLIELYEQVFKLTEKAALAGTEVYSFLIPTEDTDLPEAFLPLMRINMTLPIQGKIYVNIGSLDYLKEMIACAEGATESLATNPSFVSLSDELGKTDVLSYFRMQQYLQTIQDIANFAIASADEPLPIPVDFNALFEGIFTNFGLTQWGDTVSGYDVLKQTSTSIAVIAESNGLYRQLGYAKPMVLPFIPADTYQVMLFNLADPSTGLTDLAEAFNKTAKLIVPPMLGEPIKLAENAAGFTFADLASHLGGSIAIWQNMPSAENKQTMCLRIELKDQAAFEAFFNAIPATAQLPKEKDGAITVVSDQLAWAFADNCFYFASDIDLLKKTLAKEGDNLFDSAEFKELYAKTDGKQTYLQYCNYNGMGDLLANKTHSAEMNDFFSAYLEMLQDMRVIQTSVAAEGRIKSQSAGQFDASKIGDFLRSVLEEAKK
jgi:hypothetical protein